MHLNIGQLQRRRVRLRSIVMALSGAGILLGLLANLETTPPLWWDEGWTLLVARNWVERGHYGQVLAGEPQPPGLSAASPLIAPVALSFEIFGVGVWQGRMVGVGYTIGALILLYLLARRLFDKRVAVATILAAILMSPHLATNPIYMGRQVMAEFTMLFFLLAGYLSLAFALDKGWLRLAMIVSWGIGLAAKAQPYPFWLISLCVPLGLGLLLRKWKFAGLASTGLIGGFLFLRALVSFQNYLLRAHTVTGSAVEGLFETVVRTEAYSARHMALSMTLLVGLPTLIALAYAAWKWLQNLPGWRNIEESELVKLSVLTLCAGWYGWYAVFSIGWARYFLPVTFLGSIFVAAWLSDLTRGFNWSYTIRQGASVVKGTRFNTQSTGALIAILMVSYFSYLTMTQLYVAFFEHPSKAVFQVAEYLNNESQVEALIESYEPELFFLLDRRYHYPPDQTNVDLVRIGLGEIQEISYDPLLAEPDYIVVGPFGDYGRIYKAAVESVAFKKVYESGSYQVYERAGE